MEAVAAAASIAGIITLAAQAIEGLKILHSVFTDIKTASKIVSRLLSDINSLITVLHNIDDILRHVERQCENQNFAQLDIKVEDCTKDVTLWIETAKELRPGAEKGGRAWMRKARFAAKGEIVGRIRDDIGRHRQALCLSLAVFGRTIDLHTSEQIHQMRGRFDDALTTSLSNHGAHEEALRRIESYSITSMQSSAHSIRSMDSIRTELSRLEAMITSSHNVSTSRIEQAEGNQLVASHPPERSNGALGASAPHEATSKTLPGLAPMRLMEIPSSQSSRQGSSSASHYSSKEDNVVRSGRPLVRVRAHPSDFHHVVREQEDISKRFSEISAKHESALLYAQFSRDTSPLARLQIDDAMQTEEPKNKSGMQRSLNMEASIPDRSPAGRLLHSAHDTLSTNDGETARSARTSVSQRVEDRFTSSYGPPQENNDAPEGISGSAAYDLLHQTLTTMFPPMIAEYVSLQNLVIQYESHSKMLEERPSIIQNLTQATEENNDKDIGSHQRKFKSRLEALQEAADDSARKCSDAGHSLSDLNQIILHFASCSHASARRYAGSETFVKDYQPRKASSTENDSPSDESDAYFSSAE